MNKLNDKIVIFDLDAYKDSIRLDLKESIREELEYEVYYDLFTNMPINLLCEQFIRLYKGTDIGFDSIDEKGFCLMYSIVMKTCEYLRDGRVDLMTDTY